MAQSLTEGEKRFVLAEMIKASKVDVNALAAFIRSHRVDPDWLDMQLPLGRNMNQCMQAAEQLAVGSSTLKRRLSNDQTEHSPKRLAPQDRMVDILNGYPPQSPNYRLLPPVAASPSQAPLLPRPSVGERQRSHPPPVKSEPPRKRGRPSRADKAKRDLQPLLPRPSTAGALLAPQEPTMHHSVDTSSRPSSSYQIAPLAPKKPEVPVLLASPVSAARPITPPEAYIPTTGSSASPHGRVSTSSPRDDHGARSSSLSKQIDTTTSHGTS